MQSRLFCCHPASAGRSRGTFPQPRAQGREPWGLRGERRWDGSATSLAQNKARDGCALTTCVVPGRGAVVTLLKGKTNLPNDETRAGVEATSFWPELLDLESCSREADCFQPETV